jgi:hypothetical protein
LVRREKEAIARKKRIEYRVYRSQIDKIGNKIGNRSPLGERLERRKYFVWEGAEMVSDRRKTLILTLTTVTLITGAIAPLPSFARDDILYDCVTETDRGRRERRGMNRATAWGYLGNDVQENSSGVLSSWRGKCTPRNAPNTAPRQTTPPTPTSRPPASDSPASRPSPQPSPSSQPSTSTGLLNSCQSEVAARLAGVQASNINVESSSVDAGGNAIVNWNNPAGQSGFCRIDPFGNIIEFRQN